MSVRVQYEQVVDRPVAAVFHFMVTDHIRNHPRWDADIELEAISDGPMGVGKVIRRRSRRGGAVVEGTMEVTEYEVNELFTMVIREGGREMVGRVDFEPLGDNRTRITQTVELPGADESMDTSLIVRRLNEVGDIRKALIESEL
jgi:hypothetical protein